MRKTLSLLLLFPVLANAAEVSVADAATAARAWVDRGYAMGKLPAGRTVAGVDEIKDPATGAKLLVARFAGGGYVVLSADDLVDPVIAFSETGTGLDLLCEWRAVSVEGNKAEVTLTIGVRSASLYLNEWIDCIGLRVGDRTATMTQPGLDYTGGTTSHTFGSRTFTVDLSGGSSFPVAVEWHYNGDYGGTHIDVLECGGTITLN